VQQLTDMLALLRKTVSYQQKYFWNIKNLALSIEPNSKILNYTTWPMKPNEKMICASQYNQLTHYQKFPHPQFATKKQDILDTNAGKQLF
jgi:hypothetical protein